MTLAIDWRVIFRDFLGSPDIWIALPWRRRAASAFRENFGRARQAQPQHASLWKNGVQTDLGAFGTDCAFAVTINSKDQIAGASYPRAGATYPNCNYDLPARGFLYENGELVDLNNLVPPDSELHVSEPETINDRGEIAGLGVDASGNSRAFLLIPVR